MTDVDEILARLSAAGADLAAARAMHAAAIEQIAAALSDGRGVLPLAEMARAAGVSRTTAYTLTLQDYVT